MKNKKIVIISLGKPNAGKSSTWYEIFGRKIRTGWKRLKFDNKEIEVFLKNSSFEETGKRISLKIFVKNASFEEYGGKPSTFEEFNKFPKIIFCSVQYSKKGIETIKWFKENGYYLYIQWLNPGYTHKKTYSDHLDFEEKFNNYGEFHKTSGKEKIKRSEEIKSFLLNFLYSESN